MVASALLHDIVEDTAHPEEEIARRFPARVSELVSVMTEDASIEPYRDRKAEHRARVLGAGSEAATIYLADKVARIERYLELGEEPGAPRLAHYRDTLAEFGDADPGLPFLDRACRGLAELERRARDG